MQNHVIEKRYSFFHYNCGKVCGTYSDNYEKSLNINFIAAILKRTISVHLKNLY